MTGIRDEDVAFAAGAEARGGASQQQNHSESAHEAILAQGNFAGQRFAPAGG